MSRCIIFWSNLKFNISSHNLTHMFSFPTMIIFDQSVCSTEVN